MDKTEWEEWEEHEELIPREEMGESVHIGPDGKMIIEPWTQSQEPEEAIFHDTIKSGQAKKQLELPLDE